MQFVRTALQGGQVTWHAQLVKRSWQHCPGKNSLTLLCQLILSINLELAQNQPAKNQCTGKLMPKVTLALIQIYYNLSWALMVMFALLQGERQITWTVEVKTWFMVHDTMQSITRGAEIAQWLERRTRDWKVAGLNPHRSNGRIFFSRVNFLCWLLFRYLLHPRVTADPGHSAKSAGGRLQLNMHTPYICGFAGCDMKHGCMVYTEHVLRWLQSHVASAMPVL